MKPLKNFTKEHKIISFLVILILTIIVTRLITSISDPNIIIKGIELHHFYYGLILLIITSILMLYKRGNFYLHLILTAVSVGLIVDELIFIASKIRGPTQYTSTLSSAIIISAIITLTIIFIFYYPKKRISKK